MILELILLEIYKLNKFSGSIAPNLMFYLFTCPDRWKHASSLNQILSTNGGFCSICTYQIKKRDSRLLLATFVLFDLYLAQGNFFESFRKMLCTVADLFTLCQKSSDRLLWTFSIAGLIASVLAVDLPVFRLPL